MCQGYVSLLEASSSHHPYPVNLANAHGAFTTHGEGGLEELLISRVGERDPRQLVSDEGAISKKGAPTLSGRRNGES
jgi:hypothetical protein